MLVLAIIVHMLKYAQMASAPPAAPGPGAAAGAAGSGKGRLIFLYSALPMQTWIDGMGHRINGKW